MIRSLVQEANFLEEEEDEEEADHVPMLPPTTTLVSAQTTDSYEVGKLVQPVKNMRPRQHLVRRSSSAVEKLVGSSLVQKGKQDGGDKSLRPRFLKERSATIVHLTTSTVDPARVPRSKASAFLLGVLSKSKSDNASESRRVSLEPLRTGVTNSLHYIAPQGAERGVPLRAIKRSESRRYGRQLSIDIDSIEQAPSNGTNKRRISASQEHITAIVRGLQASKQQLPHQLEILHSIIRYINSMGRDGEGKRPIIKEMVEVGLIPELASIMREFRFHTNLQVSVMSILSALAEESSVYAYMMSEFDLEKLLQKTAAVHGTHDRLVLLASNLVHVIEESKHTINLAAYQAEKVAMFRRQSASYTDMIVASITAKPKHSLPSPSTVRRSSAMSCVSELAKCTTQDRAVIQSASTSKGNGLARDNRYLSQSAGRQRQTFELALAPPALSANYRLLFAQKLKKSNIPPQQERLPEAEDSTTDSSKPPSTTGQQPRRVRPSSSPTRRALTLESNSRSHAAAIYSAGSIFVEPSPVLKRLPYRGSLSAGGVRRKLNVPKNILLRNTKWLPPHEMLTNEKPESLVNQASESVAATTTAADTAIMDDGLNDDITSESTAKYETQIGDASFGSKSIRERQEDASGEEAEDDESYEDDFDTGDDSDGERKMPDRRGSAIGSDGELIEMLHDVSMKDSADLHTDTTTSSQTEVNAATTIQRHIRGNFARQLYSRPSRPTSNQASANATPSNKQSVHRGKNGRRESRGDQAKAKRIPLSARAHRKLQHQSGRKRDTYSSSAVKNQAQPRGRLQTAITPTFLTPTKQGPTITKIPSRQRTQEVGNQIVNPSKLSRDSSPKLSDPCWINEGDQERKAEDTDVSKESIDPESLKQIQTLYAEGLQHHKENHLGLAIDCYDRALLVPGGHEFASLHVNLGSALMAQSKPSEALALFEKAKCIQPTNIKAIYNYSLALLHLGRPQEAKQQLRRIIELEPSHEKAKLALSHLGSSVKSPTPSLKQSPS